jgi:succinate dehydrogenase / fumarate reductase, membrane anchor subunit
MTPSGQVADGDTAPSPDPPSPTAAPEVRSWSWHIMAVSSWLLLVLLPVHVLTTWVFHDPAHFGVALYVDRWHHAYWRVFDGALVVLGLVHGGVGLDAVLGGLTRRVEARRAVTLVLVVVLGLVGWLAVSTIFTFNLS